MGSPLFAALESQRAEQELEIEYCYFVLLNQEQLNNLISNNTASKVSVFSESKLPDAERAPGHSRIRHYINDDKSSTFEFTTKTKASEARGKNEDNDDLGEINYQTLLSLAKSTVVRTRLYIPVVVDGKEIIRKNGNPLCWEVDLYVDARNLHRTDGKGIHPWVKVEMEVDQATLPDVIKYIPFEYDELIHGDTQEPTERALISNLYENDYDVKGKFDESQLASLRG